MKGGLSGVLPRDTNEGLNLGGVPGNGIKGTGELGPGRAS